MADRKSNSDNGTQTLSEEDDLNPGDKYYREQLLGDKKEYQDAHGDTVKSNYNADNTDNEDNVTDDADTRQELEDKENDGDDLYKKRLPGVQSFSPGGRFVPKFLLGRLRKAGPAGGIAGILVATLGIGSSILGPASLLTNITSIFSNHMDFGNRLLSKTGKSYATAIFKSNRNCATSKIKCKLTTVSDKRLKEWEKRGIKADVDPKKTIFGRNKVRGLEFPNGRKVVSPRQFSSLKFVDPYSFSTLQRFPIRATYLDARSSMIKSFKKFGINFSNKFKASTNEDRDAREAENKKKMDTITDSSPDKEERSKKIISKAKSKISAAGEATKKKFQSISEAAKSANLVIGAGLVACSAHSLIKATQAAILIAWHIELIKFIEPLIKAGYQAKESGVNGDFDEATAEYYGDRFTHIITQKEADADPEDTITPDMVGKTATDSAGFGAALSGDFGKPNEDYVGWGPASKIWGIGVLNTIESKVGEAGDAIGMKNPIGKACKTLQIGAITGAITGCLGGGLVSLAGCALSFSLNIIVRKVFGSMIMDLVSDQIGKGAMEMIAKANLSSSLVGPALGDAIASGAGVLASYSDRASGFAVAGNNDQAYTAYREMLTDTDYQQSKIADALDAASKNQFDFRNKFSFAGQLVSQFSSVPWNGTIFSSLSNMAKIVAKIPTGTMAAAMKQGVYQPIAIYDSEQKFKGAINDCKNPGMNDLEIPCVGESGRAVPMLGKPVDECLAQEDNDDSTCFEKAVDYLAKEKMIDADTGEPVDFADYGSKKDFDNRFLMFMKYCGNDRAYPLGYTDLPIEDDDGDKADWHDGTNCSFTGDTKKDNDLSWMSFYYTMCIAHYASDNDQEYCWEVEPAAVVTNTGSWVVPTSGQCTSRFGFRWGTVHRGIDIAPPSGTTIVAPTNMEIISAGPKSDGYGNSVVAKATDGTNFSFRFGHMLDQPPVSAGQKVNKGETIGRVGSTGDSTGPHLHFEIFPAGIDPMTYAGSEDPEPILAKNGVTISCGANS